MSLPQFKINRKVLLGIPDVLSKNLDFQRFGRKVTAAEK